MAAVREGGCFLSLGLAIQKSGASAAQIAARAVAQRKVGITCTSGRLAGFPPSPNQLALYDITPFLPAEDTRLVAMSLSHLEGKRECTVKF